MRLLQESGALFIRYASDPVDVETSWWYIVCEKYDWSNLSSNMRNQIKRGQKKCIAKPISANQLAKIGYECYSLAFTRYKNAVPSDIYCSQGERHKGAKNKLN